MKIYDNNFAIQRLDPVRGISPQGANQRETPARNGVPNRADQVQISDTGRAMAGEAGTALSAERTAEIRQRVLTGAYNSLEVVDQVARRMLASGDI